MSKKILFQSLLKFRDQIKDGTAKVQDIITDYFNQTGKSVTDEERTIILNEFAKEAPANVTPLKSGAFDEIDETAEGFDPDYMKGTSDTDKTAGELLAESEGVDIAETILPMGGAKSKTPFTDQIRKENPGVEIRGDESFGELMEKLGPSKEEGIGSLFPKSETDVDDIFDLKNDKRTEVAEFIRKMRGANIKNKDIKNLFKETGGDIEQGKRAATTLARAADMKADTKIKQELLSELDEMKMDKGPRFFQEEFMGFDDFRSAENAKKIEVNNAIVDDLEAMGVDDDTVMFIMGRAREINKKPFYTSGEDFVDIIKEELDFQGIDYDVEFYKKYFRELESLMRKPKPRFMYGGVV